jgi:hypothetical protein
MNTKIIKNVTTSNRPGIKQCDACKNSFKSRERFTVVEEQVSWSRGDDEVYAYHTTCDIPAT